MRSIPQTCDPMKRVLFLAYDFPPLGGGGVLRSVKFVKYLPEFGWQPTVITQDPTGIKSTASIDTTLQSGLGDIEVVRVGQLHRRSKIRTLIHACPGGWRVDSFYKRNLQFPDAMSHWLKQAFPTVRDYVRSGRFDLLYSTSPPVTAHVLALRVKQATNIPWVPDFRDPWSDNHLQNAKKSQWKRLRDRRAESRVCNEADLIIANTETNRESLLRNHDVRQEKLVTINNGFDEEDFRELECRPPSDHFRITYAGSAYLNYTPEAFLECFGDFLHKHPDAKVRFTFAGGSSAWAEKTIQDPAIKQHLELLGQIPHRQVPSLLASSHVLLHVYPPNLEYSIPGKLFEYLRSGTPVLSIADRPSEVQRLLDETNGGIVFRHNEHDNVVRWLSTQYRAWVNNSLERSHEVSESVHRYSRRALTEQLALCFDRVVAR